MVCQAEWIPMLSHPGKCIGLTCKAMSELKSKFSDDSVRDLQLRTSAACFVRMLRPHASPPQTAAECEKTASWCDKTKARHCTMSRQALATAPLLAEAEQPMSGMPCLLRHVSWVTNGNHVYSSNSANSAATCIRLVHF